MSRVSYNYECSNCKYSFKSPVCVDGVGLCKKCGHESLYMKSQSTGVHIEKVEHKDVLEVLSKFSTEELIEALKQKEDVQAHDTTEETHGIRFDLTKTKKHILVVNNCDVELVRHRFRLMEEERIFWAGLR